MREFAFDLPGGAPLVRGRPFRLNANLHAMVARKFVTESHEAKPICVCTLPGSALRLLLLFVDQNVASRHWLASIRCAVGVLAFAFGEDRTVGMGILGAGLHLDRFMRRGCLAASNM